MLYNSKWRLDNKDYLNKFLDNLYDILPLLFTHTDEDNFNILLLAIIYGVDIKQKMINAANINKVRTDIQDSRFAKRYKI